jgi:hypothetical protein
VAEQEQQEDWAFWVQFRSTDEERVIHREAVYRDIYAWAHDWMERLFEHHDRQPFAAGIRRES